MSLRLACLVGTAALSLAACSTATRTSTEPTATAIAASHCTVSQLGVSSTNSQEALSNVGVVYVLHNTSSATCTLEGYPGLALVTTAGKTIDLDPKHATGSSYLYPSVPENLVTLAPGGTASFWMEYTGESCGPSRRVQITPPNDLGHLTVSNQNVAPCGLRFAVSPVGAGIVRPIAVD